MILESLTRLRDDLLDCKSVCEADEYQVIDDMLDTVTDLLTVKRREAGYQAVYENTVKLYEGTPAACTRLVATMSEVLPEIELTIQPL